MFARLPVVVLLVLVAACSRPGKLQVDLDSFPGVHAPHLEPARVAAIAWLDATPVQTTLETPDGPIVVTCAWQHGDGAIRAVEVSLDRKGSPTGYVRAIVQPLMATRDGVAQVRYVVESSFGPTQSFVLDGAGGSERTE